MVATHFHQIEAFPCMQLLDVWLDPEVQLTG